MTRGTVSDPITLATDFTRTLEDQIGHHLGHVKLTLTRFATLARAEGRTAADIAPLLGVTPQAVSRTVRDLTLMGYLSVAPAADKRRRVLQVTDDGKKALHQATDLDLSTTLLRAMESYVNQHRH